MALIALFCPEENARRELALAIEELGHRVVWAPDMRGALELLHQAPRAAVVVADPADWVVDTFLVEAERRRPLLPVVVAMAQRNASQAVGLLKEGALEVISPPWTRESVSACLSKALRFHGTELEVVRPLEKMRHQALYAAAAALFFGLSFGYAVLEHRQKKKEAATPWPRVEWELPYSHPSGMAFRPHVSSWVAGKISTSQTSEVRRFGTSRTNESPMFGTDHASPGEFWIADWYSQAVYRHDPASLAVRRNIPLPDEPPTAIAFDGDTLWIVSVPGVLTKHMLDDHLTILARAPGLYPHTVGLAYDGLYLWTLDGKDRVLRKHLLDDQLTVLASYKYPGVRPAALAFDGKTLWSIDSGNKDLLKHDIDEPRHILFRAPLTAYQSGQWRPTGLSWDGAHFWSAAESSDGKEKPSRIFRHDIPLAPVKSIP